MNKTEVAIYLIHHLSQEGNVFFFPSEVEKKELFGLKSQALTALTCPKILKSNFNLVLEYLSDAIPRSEFTKLSAIANQAIAKAKKDSDESRILPLNKEAYNILKELFKNIGWQEEFEEAMSKECRNAYLYGMADRAYDEWESVLDFLWNPGDYSLDEIREMYPHIIIRDDPDNGYQYGRGRLFSLADYCAAKEAIASLGEDNFSYKYRCRTGSPVPTNSHLWDE